MHNSITIELPSGVTAVKAKDTRLALAKYEKRYHGYPDKHLNLIGVTGTTVSLGSKNASILLQMQDSTVWKSYMCRCRSSRAAHSQLMIRRRSRRFGGDILRDDRWWWSNRVKRRSEHDEWCCVVFVVLGKNVCCWSLLCVCVACCCRCLDVFALCLCCWCFLLCCVSVCIWLC